MSTEFNQDDDINNSSDPESELKNTWYNNKNYVIGLFASLFVFALIFPFGNIFVTPLAIYGMWKSQRFQKRPQ